MQLFTWPTRRRIRISLTLSREGRLSLGAMVRYGAKAITKGGSVIQSRLSQHENTS